MFSPLPGRSGSALPRQQTVLLQKPFPRVVSGHTPVMVVVAVEWPETASFNLPSENESQGGEQGESSLHCGSTWFSFACVFCLGGDAHTDSFKPDMTLLSHHCSLCPLFCGFRFCSAD